MFLWAILGTAFNLNFLIKFQQNNLWLEFLNLLCYGTWIIVSVLAMLITARQWTSTIRRLGWFGPSRPRWWFEWARLAWNVATIAFVGLMLSFFMDNQQRQLFIGMFVVLLITCSVTIPAFFALATIGYTLSFALRLPRGGRAYDCVHYFYCLCGPIIVVAYAAAQLPQKLNAPIPLWSLLLGIAGITWMLIGFISILRRYERWEQHRGQHA